MGDWDSFWSLRRPNDADGRVTGMQFGLAKPDVTSGYWLHGIGNFMGDCVDICVGKFEDYCEGEYPDTGSVAEVRASIDSAHGLGLKFKDASDELIYKFGKRVEPTEWRFDSGED